jgi:4-amino-4-deoxy-L-arabinose transferase-like glycosyltransferase
MLALGLIAVSAMGLILYSTPEGLGLSDDSIGYIAGARSILDGQGYREAWLASNGPVTHFPPGFSSALAFIGLSGLDPLRGARFLNALLFGVNAFLFGAIGWQMTKSKVAGIAAALLFAVNASLFNAHVVAMSEPLYIFFSLAAFLTFAEYFKTDSPPRKTQLDADKRRKTRIFSCLLSVNQRFQRPNSKIHDGEKTEKNYWLIAAGILTALTYLTRYAGLALLATFVVALILLNDSWKKKITGAGIFLASFLPFAIGWGIRNKVVADNATNRSMVYHPLTAENIQTGIYNLSEFLVPVEDWRRALIQIPNFFLAVSILLAIALLVWLAFKGLKKFFQPASELPEILSFTNGLYIFGYLASILATMLFFDAATKFKLRILSPVYVSLLLLLVLFFHWTWQNRSVVLRGLIALAAVALVALSAYDTSAFVTKLHKGGQGYASFKWYDSESMAFLRELPEGTGIYTNQPGPVYLYTGRPAYVLPDRVDGVTGLPREGYIEGVQALHEDVLSGNAALALFKFGAEDEEVQSVYMDLAEGLYLGHSSRGDKIYTAYP